MTTFQFEALDSAGQPQSGRVQAANSDEAMRVVQSRGLFVVSLRVAQDDCNDVGGAELSSAASNCVPFNTETRSSETRPVPARWMGAIVTVAGLACLATGVYGVLDGIWFRMGATPARAIVVELVRQPGGTTLYDLLEFTDSGHQYHVLGRGCFGALSMPSNGLRAAVDIVYPPDHPEKARLADFGRNFYAPLILTVLGLAFTPIGLLVLRRGIIPATAVSDATIDVAAREQ